MTKVYTIGTYYLFKRVDKYDVKLIAELQGTKQEADQLLELMSKMNKSLYVSFEMDREEHEELPEEIECKLRTVKYQE